MQRMPGFLGIYLFIRGVSWWVVTMLALGATGVGCRVQEVTYGWMMAVSVWRGGSQSIINGGVMGRGGVREFGQDRGPRPGFSHWEEGHVVFGEALINGFTFGFCGCVVVATTVSTAFGFCTGRVYVSKFLALVAADEFMEVFTNGDDMTCNIDTLLEEVVCMFRGGANYL
jgi:hypothetical protein